MMLERINLAEKVAINGLRVVPPKPFNMVFVGNCGTGKSLVARIMGKLLHLAGVLSSYRVIELQSNRKRISDAKGGILLVDVDQLENNSTIWQEIESVMDEGETSVILAGQLKLLNSCVVSNKNLYNKLSVMLHFNDFSCQELAMLLRNKVENQEEDSVVQGLKLHPSCKLDVIENIIAKETVEDVRSKLNAFLIDQIILEAKACLDTRLKSVTDESCDKTTITPRDLVVGVHNATQMYRKIFSDSM